MLRPIPVVVHRCAGHERQCSGLHCANACSTMAGQIISLSADPEHTACMIQQSVQQFMQTCNNGELSLCKL